MTACPFYETAIPAGFPLCELDRLTPSSIYYVHPCHCLNIIGRCDKVTLRDSELMARRQQEKRGRGR